MEIQGKNKFDRNIFKLPEIIQLGTFSEKWRDKTYLRYMKDTKLNKANTFQSLYIPEVWNIIIGLEIEIQDPNIYFCLRNINLYD